MIEESVVQDVPIITEEELKILTDRKFTVTSGKNGEARKFELDLYEANDREFLRYMTTHSKMSKDVLKDLGEDGWTNANRLPLRLRLVKEYLL